MSATNAWSSKKSAECFDHGNMNVALWVAQVILAVLCDMAGTMKTFIPSSDVAKGLTAAALSQALGRFIGMAELSGALGVILPAPAGIKPGLTNLAAAGMAAIMVLATVFHISRKEFKAIPVTIVLGGLALFIALAMKKMPIG
jgi:putative oxidoreductase